MKTKQCCASSVIDEKKMKSVILYPYGPLTTGNGFCRKLHAKNFAITSAIYTLNISFLIVLIYALRISLNMKRSGDLEDVYYGVQIAYFAIIGTQMSMIALSVMLMFGIYKENPGLIVPWVIGFITFMALEAVAMVYSNVLRDHVNKKFDAMCKAEVAFFVARAFLNVLALWGVMRFYNLVRAGVTWKGPEAMATERGGRRGVATSLESRFNAPLKTTGCCIFDYDEYDEDDDDDDDDDDDEEYGGDHFDVDNYDDEYEDEDSGDDPYNRCDNSMLSCETRYKRHCCNSHHNKEHGRKVLVNKRHNKYKIAHQKSKLEVIDELERSIGSGSDENDSLLVATDRNMVVASV